MSRRHGPPARAAVTAGAAAVVARAGYATLRRRPPGGAAAWTRTNHRGRAGHPAGGPGRGAGRRAGVGAGPRPAAARAGPRWRQRGPGRRRSAAMTIWPGAASRRGFRGHLGALAGGEVTTGAVKLGGIGATGVVAAALIGGSPGAT